MRKPVFGVFRQGSELEICGFRKKRISTIYVAKIKTLISCTVTAQLICAMQKAGFLMKQLI